MEQIYKFISSIDFLKGVLAIPAAAIAYALFRTVVREPWRINLAIHNIVRSFFIAADFELSRSDEVDLRKEIDRLNVEIEKIKSATDLGVSWDDSIPQQTRKEEENTAKLEQPDLLDLLRAEKRKQLGLPANYEVDLDADDVLNEVIVEKIAQVHSDLKIDELLDLRNRVAEEGAQHRQRLNLETTLSRQLIDATSIRRSMTNLFMLVNVSLVLAILFRPQQLLSNKEIVLGLYISFATFVVYVYRSSNARALILLAGVEDNKRYYDVERYLRSIGIRDLSERDTEIVKLLLINRMEREKNSEHPYELVLKGISNSNILFKGGKIFGLISKEKPKSEDGST